MGGCMGQDNLNIDNGSHYCINCEEEFDVAPVYETSAEVCFCPFCGSEAKMFFDDEGDYVVVCQHPECGCNARLPYCKNGDEAVAQWNRRA